MLGARGASLASGSGQPARAWYWTSSQHCDSVEGVLSHIESNSKPSNDSMDNTLLSSGGEHSVAMALINSFSSSGGACQPMGGGRSDSSHIGCRCCTGSLRVLRIRPLDCSRVRINWNQLCRPPTTGPTWLQRRAWAHSEVLTACDHMERPVFPPPRLPLAPQPLPQTDCVADWKRVIFSHG